MVHTAVVVFQLMSNMLVVIQERTGGDRRVDMQTSGWGCLVVVAEVCGSSAGVEQRSSGELRGGVSREVEAGAGALLEFGGVLFLLGVVVVRAQLGDQLSGITRRIDGKRLRDYEQSLRELGDGHLLARA